MKTHIKKLVAILILTVWVGGAIFFSINESRTQTLLSLLPITVALLLLIRGPSKLFSIISRIFIFGGILSIISMLIANSFSFTSVPTYFATAIIVTGLLLERISPHARLQKWMFLAISTKIEAIIIGALVAVSPVTLTGLNWWWLIIPLMGISVILLALQQKLPYRATIIITTAISIGLFAAIALPAGFLTTTTALSALAVLWPAVVQRLIGYRVFMLSKQ